MPDQRPNKLSPWTIIGLVIFTALLVSIAVPFTQGAMAAFKN